MVPPNRFLHVVQHIRTMFEADSGLRASVVAICSHGIPGAVCAAAVAALVNCGFLRWTDDLRLIRTDAKLEPPSRRTA